MASKLTGGANAAEKRKKRVIDIGGVKIGGNNRIAIQSMCNTKTEDIEATVNQVLQLEALGCDIIRLAVPSVEAARAISEIKKRVNIPIVADIHDIDSGVISEHSESSRTFMPKHIKL